MSMICLLFFYLYKAFWGRRLAVGVLGWLFAKKKHLVVAQPLFLGHFGFLVRFCSEVCVRAWVRLWGGTSVSPM